VREEARTRRERVVDLNERPKEQPICMDDQVESELQQHLHACEGIASGCLDAFSSELQSSIVNCAVGHVVNRAVVQSIA
jgi:hypothetical protein